MLAKKPLRRMNLWLAGNVRQVQFITDEEKDGSPIVDVGPQWFIDRGRQGHRIAGIQPIKMVITEYIQAAKSEGRDPTQSARHFRGGVDIDVFDSGLPVLERVDSYFHIVL